MRPKIKITITDRRGKICPMAMHCAFPYIDILRYGGTVPGNAPEIVEKKKDERDKADKA